MEKCGNPECGRVFKPGHSVCSVCKAVAYCSKECQKSHYQVHKKICKSLNANKAQQLLHPDHLIYQGESFMQQIIAGLSTFSSASQELWYLFMATPKKSPDIPETRAKMNSLASRIDLDERQRLMIQVLPILVQLEKWQLKQPSSILLVLLNSPNFDPCAQTFASHSDLDTALHALTRLASPDDPNVNRNQVILGQQLIEAGADVNARGNELMTPLHVACSSKFVTNLGFIQMLLDNGADPNLQGMGGSTPLLLTWRCAMSAAKLLLTYDYSKGSTGPINVNIQTSNGSTMLGGVRNSIRKYHYEGDMARDGIFLGGRGWTSVEPYDYALEQSKEVEELLLSKGAIDNGWELNEGYDFESSNESDEQQHPQLPYDVGELFDKELVGFALPGWPDIGSSFFIKNDVARLFETMQTVPHLRSNNGVCPSLGQKLQIICMLPLDGLCGRLTGEITQVFPLPTKNQLRRFNSRMYGNRCSCCNPKCQMTKTGAIHEILHKFGTVHGQEVKGVVSLADEYHGNTGLVRFFRGVERRYSVTLRCNDWKNDMWEMVKIIPMCGSQGCENLGRKSCSRCKKIHYCGKICQTKHWPMHKTCCQKASK